jgi:hypothetical protein
MAMPYEWLIGVRYLRSRHRSGFVSFVASMSVIGLALGATNRRDGKLGSFVFGLAVIFAYYIPLTLGPALAKGHLIAPWLAVWAPNIILSLAGAALFTWLQDTVARQTDYWRALLGIAMLALVLVFPLGVAGGLKRLFIREAVGS